MKAEYKKIGTEKKNLPTSVTPKWLQQSRLGQEPRNSIWVCHVIGRNIGAIFLSLCQVD